MSSGEQSKTRTVGIDLGTTMSEIAGFDEHGKVEVFSNAEGERKTPSVVLFEEGAAEAVVGKFAKASAKAMPLRIVDFAKRQMGRDYLWRIDGKEYRPETISMLVLKKLKQDAEAYLGGGAEVKRAVITVPAYFDMAQRNATRKAGELAGLEVLEILDEPIAAAFAYGLNNPERDQTVVVYDLGGGTFDATVIRIQKGSVEVIAKGGSALLGGMDWDDAVVEWAVAKFTSEHGENPKDDPESYQELYDNALMAKEQLSVKEKAFVTCTCGGKRGRYDLSLEEFDRITEGLLAQTTDTLSLVVTGDAGLTWADVDQVLLVGGSTRMRQVASAVSKVTGKPMESLEAKVEPDLCVAVGAAMYAMAPVVRSQQHDSQTERQGEVDRLDPRLRARLEGVRRVTSVSSRYLGVRALDAKTGAPMFSVLIRRNDKVPVAVEEQYGTVVPDQTEIRVAVLQSENEEREPDGPRVALIGENFIRGIPAGLPSGSPVTVKFDFQSDGTLLVEAREDTHGTKMPPQRFQCAGAMTEEQEEAARHAASELKVS